jgi:hypothetical protein
MRHHPREGGQGTKRRLLRRNIVAGRAEQPAAAGIDQARFCRLRGERGQQHVEQASIDRPHLGAEIAGGIDDSVNVRKPPGPWLGRGDIAGDRRRTGSAEFRRRDVRPGQGPDLVPTFDELAHGGRADRASPAEDENTHEPAPCLKSRCARLDTTIDAAQCNIPQCNDIERKKSPRSKSA